MKELFLVEPQERYKEEFEKMVEEYRAFGEKDYFDLFKEALSDFKGYVIKLKDNTRGCDGWVPTFTFWLTNMKDEILGQYPLAMAEADIARYTVYNCALLLTLVQSNNTI